MDILLLILGLIVLVVGGEALVRSAAGIALKSNIPPLIVGLTIVSIGTSAPELFASISAAMSGSPGLAVGNVIGSNIANIALVLGATALISPVPVFRSMLVIDVTVMAFFSGLLLWLAYDGSVSRADGITFLLLLVAFIVLLFFRSKRQKRSTKEQPSPLVDLEGEVNELKGMSSKGYGFLIFISILGCIGLYFGADWFVSGAKGIAASLHIDDYIIGVTVVAFGTSIPELAASVIAAIRQQTDISIGNLIGSNIFNIGLVLGTTATIQPLQVDERILSSDLWWMLGIALLLYPIIYTGYRISRWEGFALVTIYVAYIFFAIT